MPVTLYLDWNDDLQLTPSGSLQLAVEWDAVRQRIVRRVVTSAAQTLPDGSTTAPDYVWHSTYGVGLGKLVDQPLNQDLLTRLEGLITAGVLADAAVDSTAPPSIEFIRVNPNTLWINVSVTVIGVGPGVISFSLTR